MKHWYTTDSETRHDTDTSTLVIIRKMICLNITICFSVVSVLVTYGALTRHQHVCLHSNILQSQIIIGIHESESVSCLMSVFVLHSWTQACIGHRIIIQSKVSMLHRGIAISQ